MTTVIVCGGRDFVDRDFLNARLDKLHASNPITLLIHGHAPGADRLAAAWAQSRRVDCIAVPADWAKHGRAAGPIRNRGMLETYLPALVVAFSGGRGTADMVRQATDAGVPVRQL